MWAPDSTGTSCTSTVISPPLRSWQRAGTRGTMHAHPFGNGHGKCYSPYRASSTHLAATFFLRARSLRASTRCWRGPQAPPAAASIRLAGYEGVTSFLGGVEVFPLWGTIGPDPTLVVSTGPTAVPPIQLPVGVTAGGAVVLSLMTSDP